MEERPLLKLQGVEELRLDNAAKLLALLEDLPALGRQRESRGAGP